MQAVLINTLTPRINSSIFSSYDLAEIEPVKFCSRYYDPSTGRFLQQDPDPGKLNMPSTFLSKYVYGANNPVMYNDPTGRFLNVLMWAASISGAFGKDVQLVSIAISAIVLSIAIGLPATGSGATLASVTNAIAGGATSVGFTAVTKGLATWITGNQSWEAFALGASSVLHKPENWLPAFAMGSIATGAISDFAPPFAKNIAEVSAFAGPPFSLFYQVIDIRNEQDKKNQPPREGDQWRVGAISAFWLWWRLP